MVQRWGGRWGHREEGVQAEVLCECRGQLVTALSQALVCSCRSPHWLHVAQRHQGWPFTEASLSPTMHSLQNRSHQLHVSYLSSVSSKLVFLSYDIHVWSSTAIERFNVVSLCLFTVNHIMLPTPIFPILSHYSPSPCETVWWILASRPPWYPCALPCQSFSFALYCFWSLSSFITSLHSDFGFYWTPLYFPVTAA